MILGKYKNRQQDTFCNAPPVRCDAAAANYPFAVTGNIKMPMLRPFKNGLSRMCINIHLNVFFGIIPAVAYPQRVCNKLCDLIGILVP